METEGVTEQIKNESPHKNRVHRILAYSYLFYFVSFLAALIFDFIFHIVVFERAVIVFAGFIFLVFGTILIVWAQKSSVKLKKEEMTKETFYNGPYCYTRSPTHFGLFFVMFGFGIMSDALFVVIFSILSFLITKFIFIKKEEQILEEKYGAPYIEYKKSVKL